MAREEVGKQRIHIDLVGATSMGTTMAKPMGKKSASDKGKSKTSIYKNVAKSKNVAKAKKAAETKAKDKAKPKPKPGLKPKPKGKP
tara:strand:+ start:1747 stop:2004 length:258 start_codon:yes stop_codon:yes gene_type:complete